jgi:putative hemolysin
MMQIIKDNYLYVLGLALFLGVGYFIFDDAPRIKPGEIQTEVVGKANPQDSIDYCYKSGGTIKTDKRSDGIVYNLCFFEDARACETQALQKGDCPLGGVKTTGFDTMDQKYCAWLGGSTLATKDSVCKFKNGKQCKTVDLYKGTCSFN